MPITVHLLRFYTPIYVAAQHNAAVGPLVHAVKGSKVDGHFPVPSRLFSPAFIPHLRMRLRKGSRNQTNSYVLDITSNSDTGALSVFTITLALNSFQLFGRR